MVIGVLLGGGPEAVGFATDDTGATRSGVLLKETAPNAKNSLSGVFREVSSVLDERTRAFLCDRAALIVGFVGPDGRPRAARGWGLAIPDDDPALGRLLLEEREVPFLEHLAPGGMIAVTAADVISLRSIGLKGPVEAVGPADQHDIDHHLVHCNRFFDDIEATDHTPRHLLDHCRPGTLAAVTVRTTQVYDQSPGPAAGRSLDGSDRPDDGSGGAP
jgi:hypothetical protein